MSTEQLSLFDAPPRGPQRPSEAERSESPRETIVDRPAELAHPPVKTFPIAFGRALADEDAMELVRQAHKIRLPAGRWRSVPKWTDLKKREVERILAEEGERAFEDLRKPTGDRNARGKLLKRRFRADGTEIVQLTAEAERHLKISVGLDTGYRFVDPRAGKEYFTRLFQVNRGYVEAGLSWLGLAGPWFDEWREELKRRAENLRREISLDDLDEEDLAQIDRFIRRAQILDDGQKVMEMILGQIGRQAQNPIRVPAIVFKVLLGLERDKDWKFRVEGALSALMACSFRLNSFGMQKIKAYGSFLGEWRYRGAGPGAHGDGEFWLYVLPGFLGCLAAFESGERRLSSKQEITGYYFGRKPSKEARKALGWGSRKTPETRSPVPMFTGFDAGRPFYAAAEGFSPAQRALMMLIEREITVRKDAAAKGRAHVRTKSSAPDANEPRLYGHDFCPLIPGGNLLQGALGHFRRGPEAGRTLCGTRPRSPEKGGPHQGSLAAIMGYRVPAGADLPTLERIVLPMLDDIEEVVVRYLGGLVAARTRDGRWLCPEEAGKLPALDLARRVKWFFFLPVNWREIRMRKWEAHMRERAARGETPCAWKATVDPAEAARAREQTGKASSETNRSAVGLRTAPLRHRLRAARVDRRLRLADVARILGVSKMTVSRWENGSEPDSEGRVHGKLIPKSIVPLMERWIETGEPPSPEELAFRRNCRASGRRDPK